MLDNLINWNFDLLFDWITKEKEKIIKTDLFDVWNNNKEYTKSDVSKLVIQELNILVTNIIMQSKIDAINTCGWDVEAIKKIEKQIDEKTNKFISHITYATKRQDDSNIVNFVKKILSLK